MNTERTAALIDSLTGNLRPVQPLAFRRGLIIALALGTLASAVLLAIVYGVRDDLAGAVRTWPFWMKASYAVALALGGSVIVERLARPGMALHGRIWLVLAPIVLLAAIALWSCISMPVELRRRAILGHSALYCPFNIMLLSLPAFFVLRRALLCAAPTNLRAAGFAAGLLSGAIGAGLYCLFCTESAVPFVAVWYTVGVFLPAGAGALFAPRLLRW